MSVSIPIISEFNAKGIKKAIAEFKQLEGAAAKTKFAFKKLAVPATAAFAAITAGALDFAKAAAEDQQAADQLALALKNNTKATDAQVKAIEPYISSLSMASAVADDELRPALAKLATGTKSVGKAQELLQTALNVSAATGVDLTTVADALAKGYNGNYKALNKLSPQMKNVTKNAKSFADVTKVLDQQFAGANKTFADSAQGGFKRMGIALQETKESIGAALLPVVQAVVPWLTKLAQWAQDNPFTFKVIALALAGVAASIMLINAAMALNPIGLIVIAIGAVIAAVVLAYNKFEWLRNGIKTIIGFIARYIETVVNAWIFGINKIIDVYNLIPFHKDIQHIGTIDLTGGGGGSSLNARQFESMAVAPSVAAGAGRARQFESATGGITVYVSGGDPNAIVQTLRRYQRQTGSVPIRTAPIG